MKIFIDSKLKICDKSFSKTEEGFLRVQGIISRSGTQEYLQDELLQNGSTEIIILNRPIEEVTDPISVESFVNNPVANEHPQEGNINSINISGLMKGIVIATEATDSNQVKAEMLIFDAGLIVEIENGKTELSAGYSAELEFSDDGKSAIQRKIRGNHVAFVDAARCGKECSIFDSSPTKGNPKMAKVKINNVEYEVADSVAPAVSGLIELNDSLKKDIVNSKKELDKKTAMLDASDEKLKEMEDEEEDEDEKEKKINDAAHALLKVMTDAKTISKDIEITNKSASEIKRAVVIDSMPDLKEKSDSYIEARFDILVEDAASKDVITDSINSGITRNEIVDSKLAREKSSERKRNQWRNK